MDGRSTDLVNEVLEQTNEFGVDLLFEATGSPAVGPYLVPLLAPLGTIVVVGRIEEPVPVNFDMMLMKKASIKGSRYFSL